MSRSFASIPEFVRFLQTRERAVDEAIRHGKDQAGELLVAEARAMVGTEDELWAPLAASTIEEKQRLGYTGRVSSTDPNLRTGEYRVSITYSVDGTRVILGSDDPVAPYLEWGTSRMPPRPVITPTMFRHGQEAGELIANWAMGAVAGRAGPLRHVQPHKPAEAAD